MKVECIKKINPITNQEDKNEYWLTIGKTYIVLSILASPEGGVQFRLMPNDNLTPTMFEAKQFKTVSNKIPSSWVVIMDEYGYLKLTPERWAKPNFWEDYFGGMLEALKAFEVEKTKIIAEED